MNERLEAIVSGRVQLVMYRDYAARSARRIGLTGEVKNLPNGTVRVIAEGPKDKLDAFILRLERGSLLSRVDSVQVVWNLPTGKYKSFDITYV